MHVKTRAVHIAGVVVNPTGEWMKQIARNLTDPFDGFLLGATHLVLDRDPLYTEAFAEVLKRGPVELVKIPAKSPNCNPYAERFVRTIRQECLSHFVIFGERHLRVLLREFVDHYHAERFHQGLGGQLIRETASSANDNSSTRSVQRRERLGGLLNFYHRTAA